MVIIRGVVVSQSKPTVLIKSGSVFGYKHYTTIYDMATLMDKAGRMADAMKRSPKLLRKKIEQKFGSHETLQEDWLHENEALADGISFYVKNLGCVPSVEAQGQGCTNEAVKRILTEVKKKKSKADNKLQKVVLTINPKEIKIVDLLTKNVDEEILIFRVSYCTADPNFPKVFAFNARERRSLQIRCRAFLCTKPKMAKAIALTVAQAFNVAFEAWENTKKEQKTKPAEQPPIPLIETSLLNGSLDPPAERRASLPTNTKNLPLLEIEDISGRSSSFSHSMSPSVRLTPPSPRRKQRPPTLEFGDNNECDEEFTKLAKARSNPHLLDIGIEKEDINKVDWSPFLDVTQGEEDLLKSKSSEDLRTIHLV